MGIDIYGIFLRVWPIIWAVNAAFLGYEMLLGDSDDALRKGKSALVCFLGGSVLLLLAPKVIRLVYRSLSSNYTEASDASSEINISSVLPYILFALVIIALIGVALPVGKHIAKRLDYSQYIEALQGEKKAIPITFPVFEGAYSRNPESWKLRKQYAERDGQICVFSFSDFKRYTRFLQRMDQAEAAHKEEEKKIKELRAIQKQRSIFENDPGAYLMLPEPQLSISFPEVQDAYDALIDDVSRFREQQLQKGIIADYQAVKW